MTDRASSFWRSCRSVLLVLPALFALSVAVRIPQLQQPLHMVNEWLTAHVLTTLTIWDTGGISTYGYNPVYTFDNDADRHIQSLTSGIADKEGNYYYVSYPPLTFLLPYAVFSMLGVGPSLIAIKVFSLAIHAVTAWLIYALIASLYGIRVKDGVFPPALIACSMYLFMPIALKYHTSVYFADMLVQPIWIASIWFAFQLFERDKIGSYLYLAGYGLTSLLAIYTEWLGVFSAFTLFVLAIFRLRSDTRYVRFLLVAAGGTIIAIGLTIAQYSTIAGLDSFLDASIERFTVRSGVDANMGTPISRPIYHILIFLNYWYSYYPIIGLVAFLFLFCIATYRGGQLTRKDKHLFMIIALGVPVLLHHIIFFDFSFEHEFSQLKAGVLFCYLSAALYHRGRFSVMPGLHRFYNGMVTGIALFMLILSVYNYYQLLETKDPRLQLETAIMVNNTSSKNETLYFTGVDRATRLVAYREDYKVVSAHVNYYAGRNIHFATDSLAIIDHMKRFNVDNAVVYTVSKDDSILTIRRLSSRDIH